MSSETEALLLSRVVDRAENRRDWEELDRRAREDGGLWRRLAVALREDTRFRDVVGGALDAIERAEVKVRLPSRPPRRAFARMARRCAAVLALALASFAAGRATLEAAPRPIDARPTSPDHALQQYVAVGREAGRIVELLPNVTLSTRESGDGKHLEVVFLRRLVERVLVGEAFRLGTDEHGRVTKSPPSHAQFEPPSSL